MVAVTDLEEVMNPLCISGCRNARSVVAKSALREV